MLAVGALGFGQLDSNGNGVLDRAELEKAPAAALESAFPGFGVGEIYIRCKVPPTVSAIFTSCALTIVSFNQTIVK